MQNGVVCNAPPPPPAGTETCNGIDDDCDGVLDDGAPASWVQFNVGSGASNQRWIFQYEASRPDATGAAAGTLTHRACSAAGRLPWTQVTYAQAQAACATQGARLCTEAEWQRACQTAAGTPCRWSYSTTCTTYSAMRCNGNDYDPVAGAPDTDVVLATGALPMCYASWGAAGNVFDMSGNVEEWAERRAVGINPIRGGSTLDTAGGIECGFNFQVAGDTFQTTTLGFRCCRSTMP
jgi:formylglycine-generating enzyme required for sulfatase activity